VHDYGDWYQARLARTARGQDIGFVTWQRFYVGREIPAGERDDERPSFRNGHHSIAGSDGASMQSDVSITVVVLL
jgi:hypothetical protein